MPPKTPAAIRRRRPAHHRPGPRTGRPRSRHLAKEKLLRRLAIFPDSNDADTSVSGAVLVGLLGRPQRRHRSPRRSDRPRHRLLSIDDRPLRAKSPIPAASAASTNRWPASRSAPSSIRSASAKICRNTKPPSAISPSASNSPAATIPSTLATTRPKHCSKATSPPGKNGTAKSSASSSKPKRTTAASTANSAASSAPPPRCWPWLSTTASCQSTNANTPSPLGEGRGAATSP